MKPLGDLNEHYWLVQRMARTLDVDLAAAMRDGRIGTEDWAAMVQRCRTCQVTCACKGWLEEAEREGTPREAPISGCENGLILPAL